MSSHAALGVVRSGVSALQGTSIRINCISAGQIDTGEEAESRQDKKKSETMGVKRAGVPTEIARVAGFLASGFSSYTTGANIVVDGGASVVGPGMAPVYDGR